MCEQYELIVGTVNFMSLTTHRWRESTYTSDAGREIAASIDHQPPEAIICWDGLDPSEVRPRPRQRLPGWSFQSFWLRWLPRYLRLSCTR